MTLSGKSAGKSIPPSSRPKDFQSAWKWVPPRLQGPGQIGGRPRVLEPYARHGEERGRAVPQQSGSL